MLVGQLSSSPTPSSQAKIISPTRVKSPLNKGQRWHSTAR